MAHISKNIPEPINVSISARERERALERNLLKSKTCVTSCLVQGLLKLNLVKILATSVLTFATFLNLVLMLLKDARKVLWMEQNKYSKLE